MDVDFDKCGGLVPVIIQDEASQEVLMLGFMNAEALERTRNSGQVVFFSRSRNRLWKKGESSGHVLNVSDVRVDCDADTLLILVNPIGPGVCHEGYKSCFFRGFNQKGEPRLIAERTFEPSEVYSSPAASPESDAR